MSPLEAENERLTIRVSALWMALMESLVAVEYLLNEDWPESSNPGPLEWDTGIRTRLPVWRSALTPPS